jgi:hypothetical protein
LPEITADMNTPRTQPTITVLRLVIRLLNLALIAAVAAAAPLEQTLGANIRLVYLHGAWVWVALTIFIASAALGLAALLTRRQGLHAWSRALGYTGMGYWLTYLPMSLLVMQLNWGGFFFDEPRWRVPFTFAVIGLLMQAGLWMIARPAFTSAGNLVFAPVLLLSLSRIQNILHPDSPVFSSSSRSIQAFFAVLLLLSLALAVQLAFILRRKFAPPSPVG